MVKQLVGQPPVYLPLDRQLNTSVAMHCRQAVAATKANTVLRQVQLHVLARLPVMSVAVAAQRERQHVFGHPLTGLDLCHHPVQPPRGVQRLQE